MARRRCTPRLAVAAIAAAAALLAATAAPTGATYRHRGDGGRGYRGFRRSPPQCEVALPRTAPRDGGLFAVANRGGGTVSLVDADAAKVVDTYELPDGGEPMYVGTPFGTREVWVGDRANSVLVRFGGFVLISSLHVFFSLFLPWVGLLAAPHPLSARCLQVAAGGGGGGARWLTGWARLQPWSKGAQGAARPRGLTADIPDDALRLLPIGSPRHPLGIRCHSIPSWCASS